MASLRLRNQAHEEKEPDDFPAQLVTALKPGSTASEGYRTLRTSLLYAVVDEPPKTILITSSGPAEGKTITCANLGVVLAQVDKKTLIIDGDLRDPTMHNMFGIRNFTGVVNVLAGEHNLSEVWQEPVPGLKVAPAGPIPPNPAELLSSGRFAALLNQARQQFDYVLIDSPPADMVSDPIIIATQTDTVLLILDPQRTRKNALRTAVRSLEAVGANILGTVVNNVKQTKSTQAKSMYYHHDHS